MWGYSRLSQKELATKAGLNYHKLRAILGEGNGTEIALEDLQKIAAATGVPGAFVDHGFDGLADADDLHQRVSRLENDLEAERADVFQRGLEVAKQLADMRATMSHLQSRRQP